MIREVVNQAKINAYNSVKSPMQPIKAATKATVQDSFIKSSEPSLIPDIYTNENVMSVAEAAKMSAEDPLVLTKEQEMFYFGMYSCDEYTDYIPLINASDDVKRAWMKTLDELEAQQIKYDYPDVQRIKDAVAYACGWVGGPVTGMVRVYADGTREILGGDSNIAEGNTFGYYKSLIETAIEKYIETERLFAEDVAKNGSNPNVTCGARQEADFCRNVLSSFESNYAQYT